MELSILLIADKEPMNNNEDDIVRQWRPLITKLATLTYISSPAIDFDDLMRVGEFAVVRAVRTFDPSQGTKISSYINRLVRNAIFNEAGTFCGLFTVSHNITSLASKAHRLAQEGKTNEETAKILSENKSRKIDAEAVHDLRNMYERRLGKSHVYHETSADGGFDIETRVAQVLESVPRNDQERIIVKNRIVGKESIEGLAEQLNISPSQARRVERILIARIEDAIREIMA
jgi:RNA polymerase sigma factor (sigma-70 family)